MAIMSESGSILTRPSGGILATDCALSECLEEITVTLSGLSGICDCAEPGCSVDRNCSDANGIYVLELANSGLYCQENGCSYNKWLGDPYDSDFVSLGYDLWISDTWCLVALSNCDDNPAPWCVCGVCVRFINDAAPACGVPKTGWYNPASGVGCSCVGGSMTVSY
jgi:hypothetical protein